MVGQIKRVKCDLYPSSPKDPAAGPQFLLFITYYIRFEVGGRIGRSDSNIAIKVIAFELMTEEICEMEGLAGM